MLSYRITSGIVSKSSWLCRWVIQIVRRKGYLFESCKVCRLAQRDTLNDKIKSGDYIAEGQLSIVIRTDT